MNSSEPGRPGSATGLQPGLRKECRALPCLATEAFTDWSLIFAMVQSLIPFVVRVGRRLAEHKRDLTVLDRRASGNDDDLARPVDLDAGDIHTGRGDCLDRSGHVLLPECGG